jgi:glyoxylase-like metal-dependent hydrolase (beta-lactamase superfamily II)
MLCETMFEEITNSIKFRRSSSFDSNIIWIGGNERQALVDTGTGMYHESLVKDLEKIGSSQQDITDIILTHSHIDHIGGVVPFLSENSPKIHLHRSEGNRINSGNMDLTLSDTFGVTLPQFRVDGLFDDKDTIDLGNVSLKVHHTPGHSSGCVCLEVLGESIMITGDTMFAGGSFGRVDFPTGDPKKLVKSLKKLSEMKFEVALPGHMQAVTHNANNAAEQSYRMAKRTFGF